ncbi:MAG: universal stress protein [Desulfatibacillaceae bacterium]|nr:universal stress protein [Desulfatibacillaceae bacterium]
MFKNILIPVDFSDANQKALSIAVSLARESNASITLFHVIETISDADFVEIKDFYMKLEKRAAQEMDKLEGPFADSGITIRQKIVYGNRAGQILGFALERKVDLIVLSSRRISLDSPVEGWGTISHKVGILSQCPVLLVK